MTEDKAFWKFMENNRYGYVGVRSRNKYISGSNQEDERLYIIATPQMLIGYYIEYLAERGLFWGLANSYVDGKCFETIDQYVERLEKGIEAL